MQERAHPISPDIENLIKATVRESMQRFGLREVGVRAGEDHDGDPVIFIEAEYDLSETPIDTEITTALATILRDRLWEKGETRFPHIRHKFHERQQVKPRRKVKA